MQEMGRETEVLESSSRIRSPEDGSAGFRQRGWEQEAGSGESGRGDKGDKWHFPA